MIINCVVCQKTLSGNFCLCSGCEKVYGTDKDKWPEWLIFLVSDEQRVRHSEGVAIRRSTGLGEHAYNPWNEVDCSLDYSCYKDEFIKTLSRAEKQVFDLLELGLSQSEIAEELDVGIDSAKKTMQRIKEKCKSYVKTGTF